MVSAFNTTLLGIMQKFIPNKVTTVNSKDCPWVTPEVKATLRRNHRAYKTWIKNGMNPSSRPIVNRIQTETNHLIDMAKRNNINELGRKVSDPNSGHIFWSAYNRLVNKKKITNIPPLFENGSYVSEFGAKAEIFNNYFSKQCYPLVNDSVLPT